MRRWAIALLVAAGASAHGATVEALVSTVRAGIARHRSDHDLARTVQAIALSERLTDDVVEQLETEGAGRETLDALARLQALSLGLGLPQHKPALFDAPPEPPVAEQARAMSHARQIALEYSRNLPDFLCTETVHRYRDGKRDEKWRKVDTLTITVRYTTLSGEDYTLTAVNGRESHRDLEEMGGSTSEGEFGSALQHVFMPVTAAEFRWERWARLRGRLVEVFEYRIEQPHSKYRMSFDYNGRIYTHTPAVRGAVYLDPATHQVIRLRMEADALPPNFPVLRSHTVLDYDDVEIAGRRYLLPVRAESRIVTRTDQNWNVMEFGDYRKFGSDATIVFGK